MLTALLPQYITRPEISLIFSNLKEHYTGELMNKNENTFSLKTASAVGIKRQKLYMVKVEFDKYYKKVLIFQYILI